MRSHNNILWKLDKLFSIRLASQAPVTSVIVIGQIDRGLANWGLPFHRSPPSKTMLLFVVCCFLYTKPVQSLGLGLLPSFFFLLVLVTCNHGSIMELCFTCMTHVFLRSQGPRTPWKERKGAWQRKERLAAECGDARRRWAVQWQE